MKYTSAIKKNEKDLKCTVLKDHQDKCLNEKRRIKETI